MIRPMLVLGGFFALAACSAGDVDTSTDELGKTKYHYEPSVSEVTFHGGCGIYNPDNKDCSFGFEMTYTKDYADLKTTITHETDESKKTVTITLDTWSYSQIHPMIMVGPETDDLGLLGTKAGEKYSVKVEDRKHHELWSGKLETLYHL